MPWAVASTAAAAGLGVTGSLLDVTMPPGTTYAHTMKVTNGFSYPLDIEVETRGLGQALDGSYIPLTSEEDLSPHTSLAYITNISKASFSLSPGASEVVEARLEVPDDAVPGTRYSCIYIHSEATGDGQVGVAVAAIVPVVVKVPGSQPVMSGEITGLQISELVSGEPIQILTTFAATGTYHYKARNQVVIKNGTGDEVSEASTEVTSSSIIPTFSHLFTSYSYPKDARKGIPPGAYVVESRVVLEDGTLLDSSTTSLSVPSWYKPPVDEEPAGTNWALVTGATVAGLVAVPSAAYLFLTRVMRRRAGLQG